LVDNKVNINAQDNDGWTALFYSIRDNETDFVKTLIELGADKTIKAKDNKDAKIIAQERKRIDILSLLESDKK
jgi:ankyrin repeat protein